MTLSRYLEKFESTDASDTYSFPLVAYEWTPNQDLIGSLTQIIGSYPYDHQEAGMRKKAGAPERVSFKLVGTPTAITTAWDTLVSTLVEIGYGKLFTKDPDGSRRWAYARLIKVPSRQVNFHRILQVSVEFVRLSDWYASSSTTGSQKLSATPTNFNITNTGNARTGYVTFRLRSDNAGANLGFVNPSLTNSTTGQSVASTRDNANANSELRIDTHLHQVRFSSNNGSSYADDMALVTLGTTQTALIELAPGVNAFVYANTGTPDSTLEWEFYPAYH